MQYKREHTLDGYKHWLYLGRCNYVFLDVPKFFYNKKNISKVFPLLSSGLSIQVSIIYFLIFFFYHELTEPRTL